MVPWIISKYQKIKMTYDHIHKNQIICEKRLGVKLVQNQIKTVMGVHSPPHLQLQYIS